MTSQSVGPLVLFVFNPSKPAFAKVRGANVAWRKDTYGRVFWLDELVVHSAVFESNDVAVLLRVKRPYSVNFPLRLIGLIRWLFTNAGPVVAFEIQCFRPVPRCQ